MSDSSAMSSFMSKYLAQAKKSKRENRMIFNHLCIRVEDIDAAEKLLSESFAVDSFLRPGGDTFDEEKDFSVSWLDEHNMYLELSQFEKPSDIGYDTGVGQAIGHLSEIGFFVPDMDRALEKLTPMGWHVTSRIDTEDSRMYKISNEHTPGIPVELIDIESDEVALSESSAANVEVAQIGIVVNDAEATAQHYRRLMGIQQWNVAYVDTRNGIGKDFKTRYAEIDAKAKIVWAKLGSIELELIEPRDEYSVFAEFLRDKGPGVHHIMFDGDNKKDVYSAMSELGISELASGALKNTEFVLFDTLEALGIVTEFASGGELDPDRFI